jgi:hypothetical protein
MQLSDSPEAAPVMPDDDPLEALAHRLVDPFEIHVDTHTHSLGSDASCASTPTPRRRSL